MDLTARPPADPANTVRYSASVRPGQDNQRHVLRKELTGPDGRPARWADTKVVAEGGQYSGECILGENATAGTWTLTARDVLTGTAAPAEFQVTP